MPIQHEDFSGAVDIMTLSLLRGLHQTRRNLRSPVGRWHVIKEALR
mgnify:CR=1 FL=1